MQTFDFLEGTSVITIVNKRDFDLVIESPFIGIIDIGYSDQSILVGDEYLDSIIDILTYMSIDIKVK